MSVSLRCAVSAESANWATLPSSSAASRRTTQPASRFSSVRTNCSTCVIIARSSAAILAIAARNRNMSTIYPGGGGFSPGARAGRCFVVARAA